MSSSDVVVSAETNADRRAAETERQMTDEERFGLISSLMVVVFGGGREPRVPDDVPQIAGWVKGVPRLGVPDLLISDAGLGVTNPGGGRPGDTATALPGGLVLAATFDLGVARESGALVGREARSRGFNVLCGGGMTIIRDPRCGRNFEYLSEDPWLSAVMAAETVIGNQSAGVVSMLKHLSVNATEINKFWLDAVIDPAAHRESDLLAFQIAIERSEPGSLMGAYNKVNGDYCSGNKPMLQDAIKDAIGFKGWIMSDWKAVYDWRFALNGLDQHSGAQLDDKEWFNEPLKAAHATGEFPAERLSEMVRRILRSIYSVGIDAQRPAPEIDMDAHHQAALQAAREGIVLLKNDDDTLPLAAEVKSVAVIGGHADLGVLAGGGSSLVTPPGGYALQIPLGGEGPLAAIHIESYLPSSPLAELRKLLPDRTVTFDGGADAARAADLAARSDVAIVFATKPEGEGFDSPDLTLPSGQDALIAAVVAANPRTVVVLETGNPVDLPWQDQVPAIVQAWYPGQAGGQAIAEILTGTVNPSGHLPITWPQSVDQLPRPQLPGFGAPFGTPHSITYDEGAEVGYRWFAKHGHRPRYAFGHGLGYTTFAYSDLDTEGNDTVTATFTATNTGSRPGAAVPQLYLTDTPDEQRMRLLGFERVELAPGEAQRVTITADPRLLARFDAATGQWNIAGGTHHVALATSAETPQLEATVTLAQRSFGR